MLSVADEAFLGVQIGIRVLMEVSLRRIIGMDTFDIL